MSTERPAFYAPHPGGWRDWWSILHPPYTAWHLSYVAIGACLAPRVDGGRLVATLVAFFFAVGVAAHALDELHGHPLRTAIPDRLLIGLAVVGTAIACTLGFVGVTRVGAGLFVFIAIGPLLLVGYNLELFGGVLHTDLGFALAWGAFPVLVGYFVQVERLDLTAAIGAAAALGLSLAQRALSTPARALRRLAGRPSVHRFQSCLSAEPYLRESQVARPRDPTTYTKSRTRVDAGRRTLTLVSAGALFSAGASVGVWQSGPADVPAHPGELESSSTR